MQVAWSADREEASRIVNSVLTNVNHQLTDVAVNNDNSTVNSSKSKDKTGDSRKYSTSADVQQIGSAINDVAEQLSPCRNETADLLREIKSQISIEMERVAEISNQVACLHRDGNKKTPSPEKWTLKETDCLSTSPITGDKPEEREDLSFDEIVRIKTGCDSNDKGSFVEGENDWQLDVENTPMSPMGTSPQNNKFLEDDKKQEIQSPSTHNRVAGELKSNVPATTLYIDNPLCTRAGRRQSNFLVDQTCDEIDESASIEDQTCLPETEDTLDCFEVEKSARNGLDFKKLPEIVLDTEQLPAYVATEAEKPTEIAIEDLEETKLESEPPSIFLTQAASKTSESTILDESTAESPTNDWEIIDSGVMEMGEPKIESQDETSALEKSVKNLEGEVKSLRDTLVETDAKLAESHQLRRNLEDELDLLNRKNSGLEQATAATMQQLTLHKRMEEGQQKALNQANEALQKLTAESITVGNRKTKMCVVL